MLYNRWQALLHPHTRIDIHIIWFQAWFMRWCNRLVACGYAAVLLDSALVFAGNEPAFVLECYCANELAPVFTLRSSHLFAPGLGALTTPIPTPGNQIHILNINKMKVKLNPPLTRLPALLAIQTIRQTLIAL